VATLVRYAEDRQIYVLLGVGFAASMITQDLGMFGTLMGDRSEKGARYPMASVADSAGRIHWVRTTNLHVVSVDGAAPDDLLRAVRPQDDLPVIDPDQPPA